MGGVGDLRRVREEGKMEEVLNHLIPWRRQWRQWRKRRKSLWDDGRVIATVAVILCSLSVTGRKHNFFLGGGGGEGGRSGSNYVFLYIPTS